jgi:16S rRNA (cytosine1402-N4)-methyltransferase
MDPGQAFSARELVNRGRREELLSALQELGEEPRAEAIVKAILEERRKRPLLHTSDIRSIVEKIYGRRGGRIHPATRTFQALRMAVNREIDHLREGLEAAFRLLRGGGRMAVISFHSGEDRIVKTCFKELTGSGEANLVTRKPVRPGPAEVKRNRRSRSARLRVIEKA